MSVHTYFVGISSYCKSCALTLLGRTLFLILGHFGPLLGSHKFFNMALTGRCPSIVISAAHYIHHKRSSCFKRIPMISLQILQLNWKSKEISGSSCHSGSLMFTALCVWASAFISAGSDSHWPPLLPPIFWKRWMKRDIFSTLTSFSLLEKVFLWVVSKIWVEIIYTWSGRCWYAFSRSFTEWNTHTEGGRDE